MDSNAVPYGTAFFRFMIWKRSYDRKIELITYPCVKNKI